MTRTKILSFLTAAAAGALLAASVFHFGTFSIAQFGSTRSINASAAAAVAMHSCYSSCSATRTV